MFENIAEVYSAILPPVPKMTRNLRHLLREYDDGRFKRAVRVTKLQFKVILDAIKFDKVFINDQEKLQLPVYDQLAIVLYRFGLNPSISEVASVFGVGDGSTVNNITDRVVKALLNIMPRVIQWPDKDERQDLAKLTANSLPNCVGVMDGTHVPLFLKPLDDPISYFNRKHSYSIQVQCIIDHFKRIRSIYVRYPGSCHDSRVWKESTIGKAPHNYMSNNEWIVADSGYPLSKYVVVPFRANSKPNYATASQVKSFNHLLSSYRVRVEHAFGMLKMKFRSLQNLRVRVSRETGHERACRWISASCVLYNLILPYLTVEDWNELELPETEEQERNQDISENDNESSRRELMEYFIANKFHELNVNQ